MRQLILVLFAFAAVVMAGFALSPKAAAVDVFTQCGGAASGSAVCQDAKSSANGNNPIITVIGTTIKIVSFIVGVAAVIGIVLSGMRFIIANGDANAVASARRGLIYCLIGLLVAALAQTLVALVLSKLQ